MSSEPPPSQGRRATSAKPAEVNSVAVGDIKVTYIPDGAALVSGPAVWPGSEEHWPSHPELLDGEGRVVASFGALLIETADRRNRPDAADTDIPKDGRPLTPYRIATMQRLAGNAAVVALLGETRAPKLGLATPVPVQREFADEGEAGEGEFGATDGEIAQPDLAEEGGGGGALVAAGTNEFGEMDGVLDTGLEVHAFVDGGQAGSGKWHHAGGNGGVGLQNTGHATTVAPVYQATPPTKAGGNFTSSVKAGTGKVKVRRSWRGVPQGDNGIANWAGSGGGRVFIAASGVTRMATHERGHVAESKKFHDAEIKPMETRIKATKTAATGPAADAALQAHVNWNASLAKFAADDTTANAPGGTWDTTDAAKADFYHNKGKKKVGKVDYKHYIEAP